MNETPSSEDRRESSLPLIATLTLIFTLLLSSLAWSGTNQPRAEVAGPVTATVATATENVPEVTDIDPGCGCAESCLAAN